MFLVATKTIADMGAGESAKNTAINMAVMGRQADAREMKGAFLYLASDASTFATGTEMRIDGGESHFAFLKSV